MAMEANKILLQSLLSGGSSGGAGFLGGLLKSGAGLFGGGGIPGSNIDISGLAGLYADGTDSTAPGIIKVGERGPEYLVQKGGHQVIPNDILRNLSRNRASNTTRALTWAGNVVVHAYPGMTAADARRTGAQAGAAARRELAQYSRKGY